LETLSVATPPTFQCGLIFLSCIAGPHPNSLAAVRVDSQGLSE
jgi:hypothetical protein